MTFQEFRQALTSPKIAVKFPGHWVNGSWIESPKAPVVKDLTNPSRDEKLFDVRLDRATLGLAIDAAQTLVDRYEPTPIAERIELLRKFRRVLADYQAEAIRAMQVEIGKPAWDASMDLDAALRYLDRATEEGESVIDAMLGPVAAAQKDSNFIMTPIGVALAWLPFSTPATSFVQLLTASVLSGSPMVLVSSGHAALSGILFAHMLEMAELPPGQLNVVFGNFQVFRQALQDRRVRAICYTGSREHCDTIRKECAGLVGRQLVLQSGGKNAVLVHSSADLSRAVDCVLFGVIKSAGQLCTSTSRVFVAAEHMQAFKEQIAAAIRGLKIGPTDVGGADVDMGPLYSQKSVDKFLRFQTMAKREAKETLLWGKVHESSTNGFFVTPGVHVMAEFDNTSAYQGNVLMSPDIAIYSYTSLETAIDQINTTDAPLVVSFIGDPEVVRAHRYRFLAPNLYNNLPTVDRDVNAAVTGRFQCGDHRTAGIGLLYHLTYPQAFRSVSADSSAIRAWRGSKN